MQGDISHLLRVSVWCVCMRAHAEIVCVCVRVPVISLSLLAVTACRPAATRQYAADCSFIFCIAAVTVAVMICLDVQVRARACDIA